jgi:predicted XRE-type DNA-binding protein
MTMKERFDAKVSRRGPMHPSDPKKGRCHLWTGARNAKGRYGAFRIEGKLTGAHRASWMIHRGPIPKRKQVLHSCDRGLCVNDDHLFLGTRADNMRDKEAKGRANHARGSRNGASKLTEKQVAEIRAIYARKEMTQTVLAALFGVSQPMIGNIVRGKSWS